MIAEGKKRLDGKHNIFLTATDGLSFPFADNSFDFVFSFIVFQHMPNKKMVAQNIAEIDRVLKPHGIGKIQLRGLPTSKRNWFYGPDFTAAEAQTMLTKSNLKLIKTDGKGKRYFWILFEKV